MVESHWSALENSPFSTKGQRVSILDFAGHPVSVANTQLCCCRVKAAKDNNEHSCVPVNPLLETSGGQIRPVGYSLLTPGLYPTPSKNLEFNTVPVKPRTSDHDCRCNSQGSWHKNPYPTLGDSVSIGWGPGVCSSTSNADHSDVGGL